MTKIQGGESAAKGDYRLEDGEVSAFIRTLVSQVLCVTPDEIDDAELLSNCGVNSVDLIDIVVALETKYKVQFDPKTMNNLTCRSLVESILAVLPAR